MRRFLSVLTLAGACVAAAGVVAGCRETKRGELVLAFQTDMKVPEDVDRIALRITVDGVTKFAREYEVGPSGVKLPSTLVLVDETNAAIAVKVRLLALVAGKPRVLREVISTIPPRRSALLRMGFDYLCLGDASLTKASQSASASADIAAENAVSACDTSKTCVAGTCEDARVDSALLPDYAPEDVFGGGDENGGGVCFDVARCFAGAQPVPVEPMGCTIAAPADTSKTSVALRLPPGSEGICDGAACWVALDAESPSGWKKAGDRIQLPRAVCQRQLAVAVSEACVQKTAKIPTCGPWSSVTTPSPSLDGASPPPDAGPDGMPPMKLPPKSVYAAPVGTDNMRLAIGGGTLYVIEGYNDGKSKLGRCATPACSTIEGVLPPFSVKLQHLATVADNTKVAFAPAVGQVQSCPGNGQCTPVPLFPAGDVRGLALTSQGAVALFDVGGGTSTIYSCNNFTNGCTANPPTVVSLLMTTMRELVATYNGELYWLDDQAMGGRIAGCTMGSCGTPTALMTAVGPARDLRVGDSGLAWLAAAGPSTLWHCEPSNCQGTAVDVIDHVASFDVAPGGYVAYRELPDPDAGVERQLDLIIKPPQGGPQVKLITKLESDADVPSIAVDAATGHVFVVKRRPSSYEIWRYPLP
jgi:hypothetical protein